MMRHKLVAVLALILFAPLVHADPAPSRSKSKKAAKPLFISQTDQRFLTQTVRRALEAMRSGEKAAAPSYLPPTLSGLECQVIVTIRENGAAAGVGISGRSPIVRACLEGAQMAFISAGLDKAKDQSAIARLRIELQALGEPIAYKAEGNWLAPGVLPGFLDPGRDGIRLVLDKDERWFTPAELIAKNVGLEDALRTLAKELSLNPEVLGEAKLSKFSTVHWWEADEHGRIIELHRGMTFVSPQTITPGSVDAAIDSLLRYMVYRQRPNGRFAYSFHPSADMYAEDDDEVAQSGAIWALSVAARLRPNPQAQEALARALEKRLARVVELPTAPGAGFVVEPDSRNQLGTTAQLCLALVEGPTPAAYEEIRRKLVAGMLWLQVDTGRFGTAFPPSDILDTQDRYPGQALVALAACYAMSPEGPILESFNKALAYYRPRFESTRSPAMTPWHIQAFARMALLTKKDDFADFALMLADCVCDHQLKPNPDVPGELWGAIVAQTLPAGDATTVFVAALADAYDLAKNRGDTARAERYREAIRQGTRFILQLQVRPDECFYIRSPRDAVDGIRSDPLTCTLRIDGVQHAILALLRAKPILFESEP
jgi:hypothetical protein